jgi:hypothetical protein
MKNRLGFRPSSSYPSHLWGRDERSSPFLSLPLVGSRRAKLALGWHIVSAANRCVGWGVPARCRIIATVERQSLAFAANTSSPPPVE